MLNNLFPFNLITLQFHYNSDRLRHVCNFFKSLGSLDLDPNCQVLFHKIR